MRIFTLREQAAYHFQKSTGSHKFAFEPLRPYVLSDALFYRLEKLQERCLRVTNLNARLKPFVARPNSGRRVLFYTGAGGYGDELMAWPVAKILADLGYSVHLLINPGNEPLWAHQPFIKTIHKLPVEWSLFELFDDYALFETVTNSDQHDDQLHPVDNMLLRCGIDPAAIEPARKRVMAPIPEADLAHVKQQMGERQYAQFQLSATAQHRSLTPEGAATLFGQLVRAFPELHWLAVHDAMNDPQYAEQAKKAIVGCSNAELARFPSIRIGMAVAALSKVFVSSDSFSMHLAGCLDVPCVGLWGSTDPAKRACYYPTHIPIWPRTKCPSAPCWHLKRDFPPDCPPLPEPRKVCAVMGSISAEDVIAAVRSALR